jgi:hypothetical protein
MNYHERLRMMARLEATKKHHLEQIQFMDELLGELQRIDDLECNIQAFEKASRDQFLKQLDRLPKTEQELKDTEVRKEKMPNRGHWIITPDGKKKRID